MASSSRKSYQREYQQEKRDSRREFDKLETPPHIRAEIDADFASAKKPAGCSSKAWKQRKRYHKRELKFQYYDQLRIEMST